MLDQPVPGSLLLKADLEPPGPVQGGHWGVLGMTDLVPVDLGPDTLGTTWSGGRDLYRGTS